MLRFAKCHSKPGMSHYIPVFWKTDTIPTKVGVSLSLTQWKVLCSATQVVDDLISRVKDREPVDWRYDLGEDVYVIIKAPQPRG
jgi:hypothetical protein